VKTLRKYAIIYLIMSFLVSAPGISDLALALSPAGQNKGSPVQSPINTLDTAKESGQNLVKLDAVSQKQLFANAKIRWENRIRESDNENPLTGIIIPIIVQRLEEKVETLVVNQKSKAEIDATSHLRTMVQAYKQLSPSFKQEYTHPRYVFLEPGQRVDSSLLGKDLLETVRPNAKSQIEELVSTAWRQETPKFHLRTTPVAPIAVPRAKLKTKPAQIAEINALLNEVQGSLSTDGLAQLEDYLHTHGIPEAHEPLSHFHDIVLEDLEAFDDPGFLQPPTIPDLNSEHFTQNYYDYKIELDWFHCEQDDDWWFDDDPYFHITTMVPQYDAQDPSQWDQLKEGNLYNIESWLTSTYDASAGDEFRIPDSDRRIFWANTYNTATTFTIEGWEEDSSKDEIAEALQDALEDIRMQVINDVKDAFWEAITDMFMASVGEAFPEIAGLIDLLRLGDISLVDFLQSVEAVYGGIDVAWVVVSLLSGESIWSIIESLGGACPELTIILLAIDVAGPALVDFFEELFEGDFDEALLEILTIPYDILVWIADLVTEFFNFFETLYELVSALIAICNPDDFIQSHTITITGSFDDIFDDADWGLGPDNYGSIPVDEAEEVYAEYGYGPTAENNSLIEGNLFHQPLLRFEGDGSIWNVYYNVLRTPALGSRETFGYTVTTEDRVQQRSYQPKFEGHSRKIKVSVTALNTEAVPFAYLSTPLASGGNNLGADREFYVDLIPGAEYTLNIMNYADSFFYGYVTLEEVSGEPSEEEEQMEDYLPDYIPDCFGDPNHHCQ
jgi:hypothetical protein